MGSAICHLKLRLMIGDGRRRGPTGASAAPIAGVLPPLTGGRKTRRGNTPIPPAPISAHSCEARVSGWIKQGGVDAEASAAEWRRVTPVSRLQAAPWLN